MTGRANAVIATVQLDFKTGKGTVEHTRARNNLYEGAIVHGSQDEETSAISGPTLDGQTTACKRVEELLQAKNKSKGAQPAAQRGRSLAGTRRKRQDMPETENLTLLATMAGKLLVPLHVSYIQKLGDVRPCLLATTRS